MPMTPESAVIVSILLCLAGAVVTFAVGSHRKLAGWVACAVTIISAMLIGAAIVTVLHGGPSANPVQFASMPRLGFALRLYVDGLSAMFLLVAILIAVPAALYSVTYLDGYREYSAQRYYPPFLTFLAAMYGLLTATDMMWFFFIFWQMMTIPGYTLIRYEHRKRHNRRAAWKYLIMMEIACVSTLAGAEILSVEHGALRYDFDTVSAHLPALFISDPLTTALAFALILIGFGIKMGMWPFGQVWLPDAHPSAPSPVSAMLSGVMIKTGVYGLIRYFLWLIPPELQASYPIEHWGLVISILGTVTLFTGTAQALHQDQTKRMLAFSSIGQVGYLLLGCGACMALLPSAPALASLALCATLFHMLNHGIFKGLLFLNAGSILHATGTQNLNKLGGLMRFMPATAVTAMIASFSIAGVPLFNGFSSKWGLYVATVLGGSAARYLPICAVIAIFTNALTLAVFIKFFGNSFLSRASTVVNERAAQTPLEVPLLMRVPQLFLAALCIMLGLFPALGFVLATRVLNVSRQGYGIAVADGASLGTGIWSGLSVAGAAAVFIPLVFLLVIGVLLLLVRALSKLGGASRRAAVPWLCGYVQEADCHRYAAGNFYGEVKRHLTFVGGAPRKGQRG